MIGCRLTISAFVKWVGMGSEAYRVNFEREMGMRETGCAPVGACGDMRLDGFRRGQFLRHGGWKRGKGRISGTAPNEGVPDIPCQVVLAFSFEMA